MVVVNGGEFSKQDSLLESRNCDPRGMLQLNQELVVNKGNIYDFYRMDKGEPFATGLYAQVKRCRGLRSHGNCQGNYFAAKFSPRKRPGQTNDEECVENLHEIALLSQLKNPYIITFQDAFILDDYVVTIMEFAPGGDLQSIIDADLVLLEKDASRYIFELLEALKYLHERHIAHLDIKPQNLLLVGEFPSCNIKLCDFEISRVINPGMEIREILGTPDYVAPEILLYEPLSTSADMWSVGILCYVLLTGFSPFGGDTDQETFSNIIHEPIDFPDELFEDVSSIAIDFILKVAVKKAKLRPTCIEMQKHDWVKSFIPTCVEPVAEKHNIPISHGGPKKRSPRKTMALSGSSTASVAGRRPSARSILRACKSAYDLNKMGGKTKSREALVEKMKIASGESTGGNWKLRKNLSKSREQLWESKIQLSKSCEKINYNLPGSTRWASIANFPSLDLNAMKSSTSQESVISVMSTCTNIGTAAQQQELLDWQQQSLDDFVCPTPQPYSISMPNTPPIPNFDLSSPVNNLNMMNNESTAPNMNFNNSTASDFNYPSLVVPNANNSDPAHGSQSAIDAAAAAASAVELESQKSVAELIMTFGGRVSANANAKKLDLKNQFEPILEVDGSEEQPMSLGDCSDNNSTSGVSSIIASSTATTPTAKESKGILASELKNESGNYSMNSYSSMEPIIPTDGTKIIKSALDTDTSSSRSSSRRSSRSSQQIRDEHRAKSNSKSLGIEPQTTTRRGSTSPPKTSEVSTPGLKGILKKPSNLSVVRPSEPIIPPGGSNSSRRGSIPGNCTRLYDTHTISSLAKVPKRSILKNTQNTDPKIKPKQLGPERSSSKSPENISPKESPVPPISQETPNIAISNINGNTTEPKPAVPPVISIQSSKVKIPRGLSPRERPSFILLNSLPDSKPEQPSPTSVPNTNVTAANTNPRHNRSASMTPTSQTKRQMTKSPESSFDDDTEPMGKHHSLPSSVHQTTAETKNSKFKSELQIEPAAVAIKILPLDPILISKTTTLHLKSAPNPMTSETNNNNTISSNENHSKSNSCNEDEHENNINNNTNISNNNYDKVEIVKKSKSPGVRKKSKGNEKTIVVPKRGEKSTWGIVCTGSVGRAMERFETGTGKGKKLRRGSVPDF